MNVGLVLATCDFGSFPQTYPPSMTPTPPIPPITSYSSIFSTFLFEHSLLRVLPKKHDFFVGIVQMYANWGGDRKRKLFSATLDWRHPNRPIWGPWQIWLLFIPALLRVVQFCFLLLATVAQFCGHRSLKSRFENQNNQINFEETLLFVKYNCVFPSVDCGIWQ